MLNRPKLFRTLIEARFGSIPDEIDRGMRLSMEEEFRHGGLDGVAPFVRFSEIIDTIKFVLEHNKLTGEMPTKPEKLGKVRVPLFWAHLTDEPVGGLLFTWERKKENHWVAQAMISR
jgi:hypothetical protein